MGIVNAILKPILVILTLPINILTLGLFTLVINAILVLLVSSFVPGFHVDGFLWALVFQDLLLSGFISMLIFVGILMLGLAYAWRKGVLSWR